MPSPALLGALILTASLALPAAAADKKSAVKKPLAKGDGVLILLNNGGEIKGIYQGSSDGAMWVEANGAQVGVEPGSVAKITRTNSPEAEYRRRREALDGGDADAWWALSEWAKTKNLMDSAGEAAREAVRLNRDHAEARAFLGHEKIGGRWITPEAAKAAQEAKADAGNGKNLTDAMHANDPKIVPPVEPVEPRAPRERKVYQSASGPSSPKPSGGRLDTGGSRR